MRSRISDDRAWLAFAAAHYIGAPATLRCWTRRWRSSKARGSPPGEHEHAFQPTISDETGTLYDHCARGLDQSLGLGAHGLPLFGTGDWNDGMNRVGAGGQGESVWLGWLFRRP